MRNRNILMLAAENGSLAGAKVGGVGDVIRDLPPTLVQQGNRCTLVHPSYGFLIRNIRFRRIDSFIVPFRGLSYDVELYQEQNTESGLDVYVLHHSLFSECGEQVYCHDGDNRPFASDANKFAFYCVAVAQALIDKKIPRPDVVHCHDWHTAFFLILQRFSKRYTELRDIDTVYSIHNLALQGVRPLRNDNSSLEAWYPDLDYDTSLLRDPLARDCVNPMRAGIVLANRVHTVSPTYALEILRSSQPDKGIFGGENLEGDLFKRSQSGELVGILNGCSYRAGDVATPLSKTKLYDAMRTAVEQWVAQNIYMKSVHWLVQDSLAKWKSQKKSEMLICSVGRLTQQKLQLLLLPGAAGSQFTVVDDLLVQLEGRGRFILLGSGDSAIEQALTQVAARHKHFVFLNGYSDLIANQLYSCANLFLMPSSFEPCGISQMLAMRAGQPCLVHGVGGLKDTVEDGVNGFSFSGANLQEQAQQLVQKFAYCLDLFQDPGKWKAICDQALASRFTWEASAKQYIEKLYR